MLYKICGYRVKIRYLANPGFVRHHVPLTTVFVMVSQNVTASLRVINEIRS